MELSLMDVSKRTNAAFKKAHELAQEQRLAWGELTWYEVEWVGTSRITFVSDLKRYWQAIASNILRAVEGSEEHDLVVSVYIVPEAVLMLRVKNWVIYSYADGTVRAFKDDCFCTDCVDELFDEIFINDDEDDEEPNA